MAESRDAELIELTENLLDAIAQRDWPAYEQLCDPSMTCFEPEASGQQVAGLAFHRFYFDIESESGSRRTTICAPRVRLMGEVAVVSYVRLTQSCNSAGQPITSSAEETRIWQRQTGRWKLVHFHRSAISCI